MNPCVSAKLLSIFKLVILLLEHKKSNYGNYNEELNTILILF